MFNDLAWPIQQWSRGFGKGLEIEGYPRQFWRVFWGYVEKGVFYECLTREFATKMDAMDGGFVDIQEEFPNLYRALLIKEFTDSNIHDPMDVIDKNMNIIRWIQKKLIGVDEMLLMFCLFVVALFVCFSNFRIKGN